MQNQQAQNDLIKASQGLVFDTLFKLPIMSQVFLLDTGETPSGLQKQL